MKKYSFSLIAFILSTVTLIFSATSCGPKPNKPDNKTSITITSEKKDLGNVNIGETATTNITIQGVNLSAPITLSCDNSEFTLSQSEVPANGGKVAVSFSSQSVGAKKAIITAKSGAVSDKIEISATVVNGDTPTQEGAIELLVFNENNDIIPFTADKINFGTVYVAENYFSSEEMIKHVSRQSFNLRIKGSGLADTPITMSLEGTNADIFSLTRDQFTCKPGKTVAQGNLGINVTPKNEGEYTATLVVRYNTKELRMPMVVILKKGPADVVVGDGNGKASRTEARLFGENIPNGGTVSISTGTLELGQLVPHITLNFPENGYRGVVTLENEGKFSWCITGTCVSGMKDTGENGIPQMQTKLQFDIQDQITVGYQNRLHFVFTKGDDKFEFTVDINITHASHK